MCIGEMVWLWLLMLAPAAVLGGSIATVSQDGLLAALKDPSVDKIVLQSSAKIVAPKVGSALPVSR